MTKIFDEYKGRQKGSMVTHKTRKKRIKLKYTCYIKYKQNPHKSQGLSDQIEK